MQPPEEGTVYGAPAGDLSPNPNEILDLGGNRWLMPNGDIRDEENGISVSVHPWTLKFWEDAALSGQGVPLSELIV